MKSLIKNLVILTCACSMGFAAQAEAKSKHKEQKEKHGQEKAERKEARHKEKADKKSKGKIKDSPVIVITPVEKPVIIETPKIIIEQPAIELPAEPKAAPIGERTTI